MVPCASASRTRQDNLPRLRGRVSLDNNSVDLGCALEIVLPSDGQLFRVRACLDVNDIARTGGIDGSLNCGEAGRLASAGRIVAIDVQRV